MVDFNDAVVITNRPLRRGEMFSVMVEKIVDRWSGSIEAGKLIINFFLLPPTLLLYTK